MKSKLFLKEPSKLIRPAPVPYRYIGTAAQNKKLLALLKKAGITKHSEIIDASRILKGCVMAEVPELITSVLRPSSNCYE
jgi:hypothetical protein